MKKKVPLQLAASLDRFHGLLTLLLMPLSSTSRSNTEILFQMSMQTAICTCFDELGKLIVDESHLVHEHVTLVFIESSKWFDRLNKMKEESNWKECSKCVRVLFLLNGVLWELIAGESENLSPMNCMSPLSGIFEQVGESALKEYSIPNLIETLSALRM